MQATVELSQRRLIMGGALAFAFGALIGLLLWVGYPYFEVARASQRPGWNEVSWPFAADEWGRGKAFRCYAAHCGSDITVYVRAKIGFCNCTTGVSDDDELARLSDFALMGKGSDAVGPGRPIKIAWMKGRSRSYRLPDQRVSALSIAVNDRCDAIVATAIISRDGSEGAEPVILGLLNGEKVLRWAEVTLGL